jgi:putative spermidine/putrescine transport system ATP-binding protein/spermidine/putrescine transport system ATP-binding protein
MSGAGAALDVLLCDVTRSFGKVRAVDDLSLEIPRGMFLSLLGPSGCGKTTTLRLIAGFEQPDRGDVFIRGRRVNDVPPYRRDFSMVFQNFALFPHMSVAENVAFGLRMRGVARADRDLRAAEALRLVHLAGFEDRYPRQLSGGQQQRVALARAIVIRPAVLLLDEPLGSLDKKLREEMQVELRQLQRALGITTVFVTHDQEEALTLSDRVAVMHGGRIEQMGTPRELYERPATDFVANFLGATNLFAGRVAAHAGGDALVEIGPARLPLGGAQALAVGEAVRVAVRPEKIRLLSAGAAGGLPARVRHVVYLGATTHLYLDGPDGAPILVHLQNTSAEAAAYAPGDPVACTWEAQSAFLLRKG